MNKDSWGAGPWQTEPDRLQWTDPATGLVCLIRRAPVTGALCGYVGIPPRHRYHGADYGAIEVRVHGRLTYSAPCDGDPANGVCHVPDPGEPDDLYWLGFDCAHTGDVAPKIDIIGHDMRRQLIAFDVKNVYRDIAYVRRECERLAGQLGAARIGGKRGMS